MNFSGKKILVTGASSGIGKEIAFQLEQLGCKLVLVGRNEEKLQEIKKQMNKEEHQIIVVDLAVEADLSAVFKEAMSDGVKLDGLVYSAGVGPILPIKLLKRENIEKVMSVNLYAFIEMVRQFSSNKFHNENSSIVAISSIAAVQPEKCQTAYAMSKAALNTAVEALAIELASKNIRINTIMPGVVNTPMAMEAGNLVSGGDFIESVSERQLLGVIEPKQIANICSFLLSDMAAIITGRAIYADGGRF